MTLASASEFPAKAVRNLANLTASSGTFRSLVGAATAAAALDGSIYFPETVDRLVAGEITEPWPRCIIGPGSAGGVRVRGPGDWRDYGVLFWSLELVVPAQDEPATRNRLMYFQNAYGAILREMLTNMRTPGSTPYLAIQALVPFEEGGPAPLDPDERPPEITDDVWRVVYAVEY